eukprot:jgi/Mesen1/6607/ME000339S05832
MRPGMDEHHEFEELPSGPTSPHMEPNDGNMYAPRSPDLAPRRESHSRPRTPMRGSRGRTPEPEHLMDISDERANAGGSGRAGISNIILQAALQAEQEEAARATAQSAAAIAAQARKMRDRGRVRRIQPTESDYDMEAGHPSGLVLPIAQVIGQDVEYGDMEKGSPTAKDIRGQKMFAQDGKAYNLPPPPAFALLDIGKQRRKGMFSVFQGPLAYRLCFWLGLLTVSMLLISGLITLILFLTLQPKSPSYDLKELQVEWWSTWKDDSGFLAAATDGDNSTVPTVYLWAGVTLVVDANNVNKKVGIHYDNTTFEISYQGQYLGNATIDAFYQPPNDRRSIEGKWRCDSCGVPYVGHYLEADQHIGEIPLSIKMTVDARADVGGYSSPAVRYQDTYEVTVKPPSASR